MSAEPAPKIAIVDDDASICRALKRLMKSTGLRVDTFNSGEEFLMFLESTPGYSPDCLILDLQMPRVNGLVVQNFLTQTGRAIPVVFITAHDQAGARDEAMRAGAVAFLRKPVDDTLLIHTIQTALAGSTSV